MDIRELFQEVENLESNIRDIDNLLGTYGLHRFSLAIVAANHTQRRDTADQELLIEVLESKGNEMHERLMELTDATGAAEKVIDGLVAQATFLLARDTNRG